MNPLNAWTILRQTVADFSEDEGIERAAALAFYTALGLSPTLLLFLSISAFLGDGAREALILQIESMVGSEGAEAISMVVESAEEKPNAGTLSAIVGIVTLLVSASGIFAQLQATLNRIWDVKVRKDAGWWNWIRTRLLSMGMVFAVLFLLLVSLVVTAGVAIVASIVGPLGPVLTFAASLGVYAAMFAVLFKFLPDVEIGWRDVGVGACLTAALFAAGKLGIGLYLGNSAVASSYGAAGSLVALLIWVYYSAVILFFGAEMTQVIASQVGPGIRPAKYAMAETDAS